MTTDSQGLAWQIGVWDRLSQIYRDEIDPRFEPVVDGLLRRAGLRVGERILDLGTGTGAVAAKAAALVADEGFVLGVDISSEMLDRARRRSEGGSARFQVREGAAEAVPAGENAFDVILASLSLMYVIDRAAAARELARVLRPGGRLVGAVWSGPENCDIVLFQQTAGRFAPTPTVSGVGTGALADAKPFLDQLADCGIQAQVETEVLGFDFDDFDSAWDALAGVTVGQLPPERQGEAKAAVREAMWPDPAASRRFRNTVQYIVGTLTRASTSSS
ncbi:MAG: class I SAM-dependent methyltransferase [Nocardioidaceae bacterium]